MQLLTFGKNFEGKNNYKVYGTTINYLIKNNILQIPNYIKIDVDGIEHLILEGASEYLNNNNIKSLSNESRQKLTNVRPETLGQASRIDGVRSSDISLLCIMLQHNVPRETL